MVEIFQKDGLEALFINIVIHKYSIPVKLQFFDQRVIWRNGIEHIKSFETRPEMGIALKMGVLIK